MDNFCFLRVCFSSPITQLCRALFKQITCYQKPPASPEPPNSSSCLSGIHNKPHRKETPPEINTLIADAAEKPTLQCFSFLQQKLFSPTKQANSFQGCVSCARPNLHAYLSSLYLGLLLPSSVKDSGWHGIYFTYRCTGIAKRIQSRETVCFQFHWPSFVSCHDYLLSNSICAFLNCVIGLGINVKTVFFQLESR